MLEASRVLAAKLLDEKNNDDQKIIEAFRLIVCRTPSEKEVGILKNYFNDQLNNLKNRKEDASKLLDVGEYPMPSNPDKVRLASMMEVVSAIYNLEETITKS